MNFIFHRNRTVSSVFGHVIGFEKGVPTHVPPEAIKEVIAAGGIPEDEVDPSELVDPKPAPAVVEPVDPREREKALFTAFEKLTLENKRGSFTAGGTPHMKALTAALGWEVPAAERDEAWAKFQKGSAE